MGQALQVHHRSALGRKCQQQIGFAGAGAARQHPQRPGLLKQLQGPAPIALVAPLQQQYR